jgi:plastocyanin
MKRTTLIAAAVALLSVPVALRAAAPGAPPTTHEVRMVVEGQSYRFEPAALTIHPGDRVRFTNVSGGPHNVSFDAAKVPDAAEAALSAGMPSQIQTLWGPLLTDANATYTVSFAGVPAGSYEFFCMPHMAMGMRGTITVR